MRCAPLKALGLELNEKINIYSSCFYIQDVGIQGLEQPWRPCALSCPLPSTPPRFSYQAEGGETLLFIKQGWTS